MSSQSREDAIRRTINSHGFGFQEAVIEAWRTASGTNVGGIVRHWQLCDREVPVDVAGRDYRVDAIFQLLPDITTRLYAVLETKRPRADMSDWVFARSTELGAPAIETYHRTKFQPRSVFIGVPGPPAQAAEPRLTAVPQWLTAQPDATFDVAFERKAPVRKEDSDCCLGKALDGAIEQVLRGVVGTAEILPDWLPEQTGAILTSRPRTHQRGHHTHAGAVGVRSSPLQE